jgi:lisH domain-containing protein FOPNL
MSYETLKEVMEENLTERGVKAKLEAYLRAEMFESLGSGYNSHPTPAQETRLINELIREYLLFNGYGHSLSVFQAGFFC